MSDQDDEEWFDDDLQEPLPEAEAFLEEEQAVNLMKRRRTDENDSAPSTFEAELERLHAQVGSDVSWHRPILDFKGSFESLSFQQIEIDTYVGSNVFGTGGVAPVLRLYGVTEHQHSILCHVHEFYPYFYVAVPEGTDPDPVAFKVTLEQRLVNEGGARMRDMSTQPPTGPVRSAQLVQRKNLYGYHGKESRPFYQIHFTLPSHLAPAKRLLESGSFAYSHVSARSYVTFESNIEFVLRFMIDHHLTGMNWVTLPAGCYTPRQRLNTTCQLEVDIRVQDLVSHAPEGEWLKAAPIRILSFDIECAGRPGIFPDPKQDPVIQIASMVTVLGETRPFIRQVMTLDTCAPIVGSQVLCYKTESELLAAWQQFVSRVDPDLLTGYNINNFDLPFLLDRAATLKVTLFPYLGRVRNAQTKIRDKLFQSKAFGKRENKEINIEGRLSFDVLQIVQRDYKLRSYTLNAVCAHFLQEQKEDVHHSIISDLQRGNDETRRRLAVYCLKDAYLPQRLLDRLMSVVNYTEMARVTGVPFNYLLTRGQQIKVISQLFRKAAEHGYVVPAMQVSVQPGMNGDDQQYEGATVIDPIKGYYNVPIATLDFASLYPSIMMAHNLCYTTLLHASQAAQLDPADFIRTPSGDYFIKPQQCKGLLPIILEDLLSARKRAKADLKREQDPSKRAVLDGRQLALKISANSVYGFTGAVIGKLPCIAISQSVTAFGRQMIEATKEAVERHFTMENGYAFDAKVIYGDTDSVMVKFGTEDLAEAMRLGQEAAQFVNQQFVRPISLEFEKVYFPYLLMNKKRYAGLYWTRVERYDKLDTKGIETVRRDNCPLVQVVIDTCLRKILIERNVQGAVDYAKQVISDLLKNKIDMSMLVITKALSKSGQDYAGKQAHVALAERMRKRDAGSAPQLGDRVAYVMIQAVKGAAGYEKSEDPIYVLEHNLPIDAKYYLDNQLANPLLRLFDPIMKNPQELLTGEHTRSIQVSRSTLGALSKFTVRKVVCLSCKCPLSAEDAVSPTCSRCTSQTTALYQKHLDQLNQLEVHFARLWTQCQRCQGSLHQDVLCTSRDCPIFYARRKVAKDLTEASEVMLRFATDW